MIGEFVLIRTTSAGVHCGILKNIHGTAAMVEQARRVWRWQGAFTLNEMANHGCDESSRISEAVPSIYLSQVIEVIPCTEKAKNNLSRSRNCA